MIELQHLTKRFATQGGSVVALNDINLTIQDGDIYGIIGMSGAGKSTLVRCINMLERPDEGKVVVNGRQMQELSAAELRAARREITMIFQQFNLLMQRTCLRNIMFPMELAKVPKEKAEARARELLELVGLPDKAEAYPAQLSGGQKQRIAIARALATDPKVLLCDEATSALDPKAYMSGCRPSRTTTKSTAACSSFSPSTRAAPSRPYRKAAGLTSPCWLKRKRPHPAAVQA